MNRILSIFGKDKKNRDKHSDISMMLHSLGPKTITDEKELKTVEPYLKLLAGCVEDKRITNIAVTGTYGSGKSTILKTFQNWYKPYQELQDKKYLNISLASFDAEKPKPNKNLTNNKAKDFERQVELSILQQMFYQVKASQLPASRFKRIKNISPLRLMAAIGVAVLGLFSLSVIARFSIINSTPLKWFIENPDNWWNVVPWLIMIICLVVILKKLFYLFNNSRIHKVSIKGEMELGGIGESVFNQYLEEILYFFERTKYDVVILEDIDRFGDTQLFTKLREVNVLLNSSIGRKIKFIYAVKDDVFKSRTERTKFFDFIIPIIPFVNPSNASDQLKKMLTDDKGISDDFLEEITSFIGDIDMRLVINVFNEFNLYRQKIPVGKLDSLLAIVFYKNLYPDDFADLHQNKGKLFDLLSKKKVYQNILRENYENRIAEIEKRIKEINDEEIKSIQELRSIYLFSVLSRLPELSEFDMGFGEIGDALSDDNFKKIISSETIKYITRHYNSYYGRWDDKTKKAPKELFKSIEKEISDIPYSKREKNIQYKTNGELERLRKKKLNLLNELNGINFLNLPELFGKTGQEKDFAAFEEEGSLIRYLVLRGFIDDNYRDYISLFFDVSITREDYDFIQNVKLAKPAQFEFAPSSPQKVLAKISESYLTDFAALNFELVSYCLNNKKAEATKLKLYIDLLSSSNPLSLKFITGFVKNKPDDVPLLIAEISGTKTDLWHQLLELDLPENELEKWAIRIFYFAQKPIDILNFENVESLEEYIRKCEVFEFSKALNSVENLKSFIAKKDIKIEALDLPEKEQMEFFKFIYEGYHFKLSVKNIIQIVRVLEPDAATDSLQTSNYSTLKELEIETLLKIVKEDFENYLNRVLLSEKNKEETVETIIDVLNRSDINTEIKEEFILHQTAAIESLSKVKNFEVKQMVVSSGKLTPTWDNIFDYFDCLEKNVFDETLVQYLNKKSNYLILSNSKIKNTGRDEEFLKSIDKIIISCNDLNNEAYSKLLKSLRYSYRSFGLSSIDQEKIEILIKQKVLLFTKSNYDEIMDSHPEAITPFLITNQEDDNFIDKIDEFDIGDDVLIEILKSADIKQIYKIGIVENIEEDRITSNSKLAKCIFNWWTSNTDISFSFEVLETMFNSNTNTDKKMDMLLHFVAKLDKEQFKALTMLLGEEFEKLFIPHQKPKFEKYGNTLKFIEILKDRELISSFKVDGIDIKAFPFNR